MLQLKSIVKDYGAKENVVHALKGVSLNFRDNEFVSILGQSGCGKTTLLNIVGGLDRYTSGDLIIDGISTKKYQDVDWDAYRNGRIGFIFQSYNLINHIDILSNVEMSLTLSGVPASERKERALKALEAVGLKDQVKKKPNQLSGGQMQRVSIARALINNPNIILADEPTGALDSNTSIQIMEILKEIAKDRLVIMVTHNPELAEEYSTRIVRLSDGEVVSDSNPCEDAEVDAIKDETTTQKVETSDEISKKEQRRINREKKKKLAKTSMSFFTALKLSFTNLMTKKARTILTAVAGSIGIIGLSLVLAISNGFSAYVKDMEQDMLAGYPISIEKNSIDYASAMDLMTNGSSDNSSSDDSNLYPNTGKITPSSSVEELTSLTSIVQTNTLDSDYIEYLSKMDKKLYGSIYYKYNMKLNVVGKPYKKLFENYANLVSVAAPTYASLIYNNKDNSDYLNISDMTSMVSLNEITGDETFINNQYDCLYGAFPKSKDEIILIVNESNKISDFTLATLGMKVNFRLKTEQMEESYTFEEIIEQVNENPLKVYANNEYYYDATTGENRYFKANNAESLYTNEDIECVKLKVVGIYRKKESVSYTTMQTGIAYTSELVEYLMDKNFNSDVVEAQRGQDAYVLTTDGEYPGTASDSIGSMFGAGTSISDKEVALEVLGGSKNPVAIYIYPTDFDSKEGITSYLDKWNDDHAAEKAKQVSYNDMADIIASTLSQMIRIITIALTAFSSVSLFVSSFMIGIITYVSVVERTKEIGILRSLGARKKDISRVFNAETLIIGFFAGLIGVVITYILSIPINIIINWKAGMVLNLCALNPLVALAMVALSMFLTFVAGLIPSRIAAKQDPVIALRTE